MVLISVMLTCFCVNFWNGGIEVSAVVSGFIPKVKPYAATQAVGILGAVIMPHNIFLHSGLVQSRSINRSNSRKVHEANKYFSIEAAGALLISFLINLAVLGVFALGFFSPDCTASFKTFGVNTACMPLGPGVDPTAPFYGKCRLSNGSNGVCQEIGLSEAGKALSGLLGGYAQKVWAIGLLAAGQSSTMTGTYAGQIVMEGFLRLTINPWKRVALTRSVALIPAIMIAAFSERNPGVSDHMDELLNVLQSIQLPFALLPVLHFTSNSELMGEFRNGAKMKLIGWTLGLVVCMINLYLIKVNIQIEELGVRGNLGLVVIVILYFGFLLYLVKNDVREFFFWLWRHANQTTD